MKTVNRKAQIDVRSYQEAKTEVIDFFQAFDQVVQNFDTDQILQMDETPTWFDMPINPTIDLSGAHGDELTHCNHVKDRFTTCLTIVANGLMLTPYVIFSKLKKPPNKAKCPNEFDLFINVSESGIMNDNLIIDYINKVVQPYSQKIGKKILLIWDAHESHVGPLVKQYISSLGHQILLIPVCASLYVQPMEVCIKKPFKDQMRDQWDEWFENTEEKIVNGSLKRASYGEVVDWVYFASQYISPEVITNSFYITGLTYPRDTSRLHYRLSHILAGDTLQMIYKEDIDWDNYDEEFSYPLENDDEVEILTFT